MKNRKYRFYAIIEVLVLVFMAVLVIFSLIRVNESLWTESGKTAIEEVIYLIFELVAGITIFAVCVHLGAKSLNEELYLENKRLHLIVDSGCSLIFEYHVQTKAFKWYGDAGKTFNISERKLDFESLLHPDDWPVILQQLEDAKRNKTYSSEVKLLDAKGEYRICNCRTIVEKNCPESKRIILAIIQEADVRQRS